MKFEHIDANHNVSASLGTAVAFVWSVVTSQSLWTAVIISLACFLATKSAGLLWDLVGRVFRGPQDGPGKTGGG